MEPMMTMMKGNEALGEAAIRAGCRFFFGYPITPQSELPAYMARRMPEVGGTFLQAESELAAVNMLLGASAAGVRAMTSSSSPGFSLKQEGISYMIGSQLPCVVVNIMRGGPGLGNIQPSQADYFQVVKGGGHGDYRMITLAPSTVQELVDLTMLAFDLADAYRNPVALLGDGLLGQTMEPVSFPPMREPADDKDWALTGARGRAKRVITSLELNPEGLEALNLKLQAKFAAMEAKETRWEEYRCDDAELVVVAYGTSARIARAAVDAARSTGLKVGLYRPITVWPFPHEGLARLADRGVRQFLDVEMSSGQMVEDVKLAVLGRARVDFYGRLGGMVPTPREILSEIQKLMGGEA
ncbi:2-oxoglutarate ferredoxin oxidoreductase subunit alpha [Symbiobacterium terraclitae]|uniref:2-oxoglutarate ferredoxin oxidoreductase subunit alpha n=1 Tax=Symbiobacterium terraclitae TaxID=557451 RepID=A0ABS4JSU6_9FIRM|nr:3-methyl-2-oxobutanoate dehydrogenase subunit VorB [Symbiobacterium terraclitae]MBP2018081.1 2-oxoglutarate ferredoxin oxidoreductase subunit alpha [Symbiobacterium terraclitae]